MLFAIAFPPGSCPSGEDRRRSAVLQLCDRLPIYVEKTTTTAGPAPPIGLRRPPRPDLGHDAFPGCIDPSAQSRLEPARLRLGRRDERPHIARHPCRAAPLHGPGSGLVVG